VSHDLFSTLAAAPVMPLVIPDSAAVAVKTCHALAAGGLGTAEIVLRTASAIDAIRAVAAEVPGTMPGAGTVLNAKQAEAVLDAGARFIVSPGLNADVVAVARERGIPVLPGVYTPTELTAAFNLGLETVKFFPAAIAGGVAALQAYSGVFRTMRFMPTGGITTGNLADFLAVPAVIACGGSWLAPADALAAGRFDVVTALAREAADIAIRARAPQQKKVG